MTPPTVSYPVHLDLRGRRALVVGAGRVATRKIERLAQTGAELRVVALQASAPIRKLADEGRLQLSLRTPVETDSEGCFLVILATDDDATNARVAGWARTHGALVSRVDAPHGSDFTVPAFVRGQHCEATVSTFGEAPSASRRLARELASWALGAPDRFAGEVAAVRRALAGRADATQRLRKLNDSGLYEACAAGDEAGIRGLIAQALDGLPHEGLS
ncbi:MAG: bifunctional precorrin-2 dehydrogenase/sirohydrochlorin ferrochelatase [Polyangiales bacterium]